MSDSTDAPSEGVVTTLRAELTIAREAAAAAETERGDVLGALTETSEQLSAAVAAQADWERLRAEQTEELRQCRERLLAIETSRTWRATQAGLTPYRLLRGLLDR